MFNIMFMQVKRSERMSGDMQQRLEDLHSLQETARRSYIHMASNNVLSLKQVHVKICHLLYLPDFPELQNLTTNYFCRLMTCGINLFHS